MHRGGILSTSTALLGLAAAAMLLLWLDGSAPTEAVFSAPSKPGRIAASSTCRSSYGARIIRERDA